MFLHLIVLFGTIDHLCMPGAVFLVNIVDTLALESVFSWIC